MFPVSLAVFVSNEAVMQKAVSETNGSVQNIENDMRGDASITEACVFNGDSFGNLTVVSSRMELNFEPNSSVLSCARVRGEKNRQKNAEKR